MTTDQPASAVIPMLSYEDPARAADWVAEAFGFRETGRWAGADGRVTHVNMERNGAVMKLGSPGRDYQNPRHHAEICDHARAWLSTPFIVDGVLVYVDDIDVHFERARASGATVLSALEDNTAIGQQQYRVEDLEGHRWMFAQPV